MRTAQRSCASTPVYPGGGALHPLVVQRPGEAARFRQDRTGEIITNSEANRDRPLFGSGHAELVYLRLHIPGCLVKSLHDLATRSHTVRSPYTIRSHFASWLERGSVLK